MQNQSHAPTARGSRNRAKNSAKVVLLTKKSKSKLGRFCKNSANTTMQPSGATCANAANTKKHCSGTAMHPDHTSNLVRLRRVQGQLAGIERMINDRRYCMDILIQLRAVASAIKATEGVIFEKHVRSCIQNAVQAKNKKELDTKIDELMNLFLKL